MRERESYERESYERESYEREREQGQRGPGVDSWVVEDRLLEIFEELLSLLVVVAACRPTNQIHPCPTGIMPMMASATIAIECPQLFSMVARHPPKASDCAYTCAYTAHKFVSFGAHMCM